MTLLYLWGAQLLLLYSFLIWHLYTFREETFIPSDRNKPNYFYFCMLDISTLGRVLHYQCKAAHFYSASDFKITYQLSGRWLTFIQSCHSQEQTRRIKTRATLGVTRWEVQYLSKYLLVKHKITIAIISCWSVVLHPCFIYWTRVVEQSSYRQLIDPVLNYIWQDLRRKRPISCRIETSLHSLAQYTLMTITQYVGDCCIVHPILL